MNKVTQSQHTSHFITHGKGKRDFMGKVYVSSKVVRSEGLG